MWATSEVLFVWIDCSAPTCLPQTVEAVWRVSLRLGSSARTHTHTHTLHTYSCTHNKINACMSLQASVLEAEAGDGNRNRKPLLPLDRMGNKKHTITHNSHQACAHTVAQTHSLAHCQINQTTHTCTQKQAEDSLSKMNPKTQNMRRYKHAVTL